MTSAPTRPRPGLPSAPSRGRLRRAVVTGVVVTVAVGLVAALSTGTPARLLGWDPAATNTAPSGAGTTGAGTTGGDDPDSGAPGSSSSVAPGVFSAAAVSLEDNDGGAAMFTLSNLAPGDGATGCITVTYHGAADASIRLYGTTTGTGLNRYLHLTITRGSFPSGTPPFDSCAGFVSDAPDYVGAGPGVVYDGTLDALPDDYDSGLDDPPGAPEPWGDSDSHAYRFAVTLADDNAAQGLTAGQTFKWEARGDDPPLPPVPVPVVDPDSGPPGTVVLVGSGSDPCVPPTGAVAPEVRVWLSTPGGAPTLAEATFPVAADGSWSGTITVPDTARPFTDIDVEGSCYDAAGVAAAADTPPYRIYTPVPFTVVDPAGTPGTPGAPGTPTVPGMSTPAPPAPPATPVAAQPRFTG